VSGLPNKVVLATGNAGKIRELARLLDGLGVEVVAQSEFGVSDAIESGVTFAENSLIKARHAAAATGLPAIADDSGLSVDALDGAPGVYSARYAGPDADDERNNDKLLAALEDVDDDQRGAAFHCVATYVAPDEDRVIQAEGVWRGSILRQRQGGGGFGYDPIFLDPQSGMSSADLTPEQKSARSHRGQALRALIKQLQQHYS
jgi:XTP/dITP diphosphohydrolase